LPNYKITVEYDGGNYSGWQLQPSGITCQGEIEKSLSKLGNGELIRVHGAGRTDSGVHAKGQVANFNLEKQWDCIELQNALNAHLNSDIKILDCQIVLDDFHSRFSAVKRSYSYRCSLKNSVHNRHYCWQIPFNININLLNNCSELVKGEHDFTSFCKNSDSKPHRLCTVFKAEWSQKDDSLFYTIEANRFLHHMVRYIVGTMMEVARGKLGINQFNSLIENPNREARVYKAPPRGLYLERIDYE